MDYFLYVLANDKEILDFCPMTELQAKEKNRDATRRWTRVSPLPVSKEITGPMQYFSATPLSPGDKIRDTNGKIQTVIARG